MGFSMRFHKETHFLLTTCTDFVDDRVFKKHILDHNSLFKDMDIKELADLRHVNDMSKLSVNCTIECGQLTNNMPNSLLAIVHSESLLNYGMVRAFQTFALDKRRDVQLFKDIESAIDWLASDMNEKTAIQDFINAP